MSNMEQEKIEWRKFYEIKDELWSLISRETTELDDSSSKLSRWICLTTDEELLKKIEETTILENDFKGTFSSADIHISPDGKFLYASNRGEANTITIFKIIKNGKLQMKGQTSTLGKGPRNFAIDPTGNFLLVAHQFTNDVVIFKRNKTTGMLLNTGKKITLCSPVCLVFTKN